MFSSIKGAKAALPILGGLRYDIGFFSNAHFAAKLLDGARSRVSRTTVELVWELHTMGAYTCTN